MNSRATTGRELSDLLTVVKRGFESLNKRRHGRVGRVPAAPPRLDDLGETADRSRDQRPVRRESFQRHVGPALPQRRDETNVVGGEHLGHRPVLDLLAQHDPRVAGSHQLELLKDRDAKGPC